jgi:glycerate kinase
MKILLALDKFKGSFTAEEATALIAQGIREATPKATVICRPIADGGEGTASALASLLSMETRLVWLRNLNGEKISAHVRWLGSRRLALIESAEVLRTNQPWGSSELFGSNSTSLGKLIERALELRPQELWIGLGGTLTSDAGWGLASRFGLRATDKSGATLEPSVANLEKVHKVDFTKIFPELERTRITLLCDVNAPFEAPGGVHMRSFLAQKGADAAAEERITRGLRNFIDCLANCLDCPFDLTAPFTGAAGGMVFGLSSVHEAVQSVSGAQFFIKVSSLNTTISECDAVVCGEGKLDETSLYGKSPFAVAQTSASVHRDCIGVFGDVSDVELCRKMGLSGWYTLTSKGNTGQNDLPQKRPDRRSWLKHNRNALREIGRKIALSRLRTNS